MKKTLTILGFLVLATGCDSGEDAVFGGNQPSDFDSGEYCSHPDSTVACDDVCEGGYRECGDDNELGECICPEEDGGTGGTAGQGGSGGSGGEAGSAGEAGSSGSSGTGGSSGSSGTGGAGGTAGSSGSSGSAGSGGAPFSVECDQYGEPGKTIIYLDGPLSSPSNGVVVAGWINFPNWMGDDADIPWGLWFHGTAGDNKVTLEIPDVVDGTILEFAPGSYPSPTNDQESAILDGADYWCEENECPFGTVIVCKGKNEVCANRKGVLTGNADYADAPWVNHSCLVE